MSAPEAHGPAGERSSLDRVLDASLPLLLGAVVLRLVVTGTYRDYVKDSMWPYLTLSGFALLALAAWELLARRATGGGHRPRVAWLLVAPVVLVMAVAPGALGSSALERATRPRARVTADGEWAALPRDGVPVELTIGEFVDRSYAGSTVAGVTVRLTGFVAPGDDTAAFLVVRFRIACCAADASPVAVRAVGDVAAADVPTTDTWVTVTGVLEADDPPALDPRLRVTAIERIPEPDAPYESVVR